MSRSVPGVLIADRVRCLGRASGQKEADQDEKRQQQTVEHKQAELLGWVGATARCHEPTGRR
jgi:hypothetical protein